jgi:hypothetical protein
MTNDAIKRALKALETIAESNAMALEDLQRGLVSNAMYRLDPSFLRSEISAIKAILKATP